MGWKATCAMEERFRFVEDWQREEESVAELCRRYGVSRQTGHKWIGRYREGGLKGLEDRSRATLRHPNQVLQDVVDAVVANRGDHPRWGPEKLRAFCSGRLRRWNGQRQARSGRYYSAMGW